MKTGLLNMRAAAISSKAILAMPQRAGCDCRQTLLLRTVSVNLKVCVLRDAFQYHDTSLGSWIQQTAYSDWSSSHMPQVAFGQIGVWNRLKLVPQEIEMMTFFKMAPECLLKMTSPRLCMILRPKAKDERARSDDRKSITTSIIHTSST
jgi:hypothetical protein